MSDAAQSTPMSTTGQAQVPQFVGQFQMQIPQIVANGATNSITDTEVVSFLTFMDRPLVSLIMSPIFAKTYALLLLSLVEKYEGETGIKVPSKDDIEKHRAIFKP